MPYQQMGIKDSCIFGQQPYIPFVLPVFSVARVCFWSHLLVSTREEKEKSL